MDFKLENFHRNVPEKDLLEDLRKVSALLTVAGKKPIDHILPWSKSGETHEENLQTLCFDCNRGKTDSEDHQ